MMELEDYLKAKKTLENFKVCGNWSGTSSGVGCNKVFGHDEVRRTICYGQTYYWCPPCYEKVKED